MFLQTMCSQLHLVKDRDPSQSSPMKVLNKCVTLLSIPLASLVSWQTGEKKLTVHRYFNQRLLDADGRFYKDVEYLLTAQYAVESKQVADDASIMLRQSKGKLYRGQALSAGLIWNRSVLLQMIERDDAYKFLKNVHGSPAYFQRVQYEVLAMIRQLGIPTFFLTLSAVDMQ